MATDFKDFEIRATHCGLSRLAFDGYGSSMGRYPEVR